LLVAASEEDPGNLFGVVFVHLATEGFEVEGAALAGDLGALELMCPRRRISGRGPSHQTVHANVEQIAHICAVYHTGVVDSAEVVFVE